MSAPPSDARLVAFLYVLLRDHLPSGVVERIMMDHVEKLVERDGTMEPVYARGFKYSNPHGEAHACALARRLAPVQGPCAGQHEFQGERLDDTYRRAASLARARERCSSTHPRIVVNGAPLRCLLDHGHTRNDVRRHTNGKDVWGEEWECGARLVRGFASFVCGLQRGHAEEAYPNGEWHEDATGVSVPVRWRV